MINSVVLPEGKVDVAPEISHTLGFGVLSEIFERAWGAKSDFHTLVLSFSEEKKVFWWGLTHTLVRELPPLSDNRERVMLCQENSR